MRRKMKRFLASAMAFTLAFTMTGTSVLAAGNEGKITPGQSIEETVPAQEMQEPEEGGAAAVSDEASKPETGSESDAAREYQEKLGAGYKADFVLNEGFEGYIPSSWLNYSETGDYFWSGTVGDHEQTLGTHQGLLNALFDSGGDRDTGWLVSPEMNLSGANYAYLGFWYANRAWGSDIDEVAVYYRVNGGTWNALFLTDGAHEGWTNEFIALPSGARKAKVQIGFKAVGHYGYGVALDDVQLIALSENVNYAVTYNANGGTGTMTDPNSPYVISATVTVLENQFVGPDGADFIGWNTNPDGTGTTYAPGAQFSALDNTTLYAIWSLPATGLNEGFENGMPITWTITSESSNGYAWTVGTGDGGDNASAHGGSHNALITWANQGDVSWLITPWLNLSDMVGAGLSFWYVNSAYDSGVVYIDQFGVYYRTKGGDWTELFFTEENHETWTEQLIVLPGNIIAEPIQIGFKAIDGWGNGIGLDDVSITEVNTGITYSVSYNANGGSGQVTDETDYYMGQTATVLEDGFTAPAGKYFIEWNTDPNGNGTSYHAGETLIVSGNITLYAIWSSEKVLFDNEFSVLPMGWSNIATSFLYQWINSYDHLTADSSTGEGEVWLTAPVVDLSNANYAILQFTYAKQGNEAGNKDFSVCYRVNSGDWQELDFTPVDTNGNFVEVEVFLPKDVMEEHVQIGFLSVSCNGHVNMIKSAKLTCSLREDVYGVLISDDVAHGSVIASPAYGEAGDEITLTMIPDGGYAFDSVTVLYDNEELDLVLGNDEASFTLPAGDVVVMATFVKNAYFVNISDSIVNGTVKATPAYGNKGDEIILTVTPNGGYILDQLSVKRGNTAVSVTELSNGQFKFKMPAGDVVVNCTFRSSSYFVTISDTMTHGTVVPSGRYGEQGESITLTVIPEVGYELKTLTITKGGVEVPYTEENGVFTFQMPKGDVVVNATFIQIWDVIYHEDFENNGFDPEGWTYADANGDGYNWYPLVDRRAKSHSGTGILTSASNFIVALRPDNWAFTPAITVPKSGKLTFWIVGQDSGYPEEHMGVYVGTEPEIDSMQELSGELTATAEYVNYTYDLSAYADQTVYFGFRHYDSYDLYRLNLDDVTVYTMLDDVERDPVLMGYAKAALDGKLGLAFFVELPAWIKRQSGAYVILTQCDAEKKIFISDIVAGGMNDDGLYRVPIYMPAAYYRENINMRFYDGNGNPAPIAGRSSHTDLTATGVNYTLEKNVKSLKNSPDAKTKKLAVAIDDYCTAAQIFFNHPTEGVTLTLSSAVAGVTQADLSAYKSVRTGEISSRIEGFSLNGSFESDCALKIGIIFKGDGNKKSGMKYYIQKEEGGALIPTTLHGTKSSGYYLAARNIPAAYLGKNYTFVIKDTKTNQTCSIACSLFTYVRASAFNATMSTDFQNLAKALYLYGKAAQDYFAME